MSALKNARAAAALCREIGVGIHDAVRASKSTDGLEGTETQMRGAMAAAIAAACGEAIGVLVGQSEPGARAAMLTLAVEAMREEAESTARDVAARRAP